MSAFAEDCLTAMTVRSFILDQKDYSIGCRVFGEPMCQA
jgi:hypothetical protein